ncbi:MAG: magnesium transporter, partial [Gammaproteobacteria bacterium]|nr:magnesium transporter [Gammaproteobacteria bacterium]
PWEVISGLLERKQLPELDQYLQGLPSAEAVRALFRLSPDEQEKLLTLLPPESAADLIDEVPDAHAAGLLDGLEPGEAASIVNELDSDEAADVLAEMDREDVEQILNLMDAEEAAEARQLIDYDPDTAGGLMMKEFLSYPESLTVADAVAQVGVEAEDYPIYYLQHIFVVGPLGKLLGVAGLTDIARARPTATLEELATPVDAVNARYNLEELEEFFEERDTPIAPVVDDAGRLLGAIRRRAVYDAIAEKADESYLKSQGIVGGDEFRSMPLYIRSGRRLSWLIVKVFLNLLATSVIAVYEDTLAAALMLAVFLPIVSDMSGCSGYQAVAVSMRELALDIIKPSDMIRVCLKEISLGLVTGLVLGTVLAAVAWFWKGNAWLGVVVGGALAINTIVAVVIGGALPLVLKRLRIDPALAAGPLLTTITDTGGFFLVLSLATWALPLLAA